MLGDVFAFMNENEHLEQEEMNKRLNESFSSEEALKAFKKQLGSEPE